MQTILNLLGVTASLMLSFISSGMETALYRVSRVRLRVRSEAGDRRSGIVLRVLTRLDAMVTTILISNNIAAYTGTFFLSAQLLHWRVPHTELITTAVITPLFFILTESLPKQLAYTNAERFTSEMIRVFSTFRIVFAPAVFVLNLASSVLRRLFGAGGQTPLAGSERSLLLEHLSAGVAEKVLTAEQNKMAARVMEMESISAGDSMVPLHKLLLLPQGVNRSRAIAEMNRRRRGLAVLIDAAGRPTTGVITMTGFLMNPGEDRDAVTPVAEYLATIAAEKTLPDVLNLFRRHHARNALVTKGNRIVGLITTRSVLNRIAGQL